MRVIRLVWDGLFDGRSSIATTRLNDAKSTRRAIETVRWGTRAVPIVVASAVAMLVVRQQVRKRA